MHGRVHFVAGAIQKASVDEHNTVADRVNAGGKVCAGAAFFVHDADLDRMACKAKHIFDRVKQVIGECGLFGAVHFGFNDIDAARAAIAMGAKPLKVVQRAERREQSVEYSFGRFAPVREQYRRIGHQMPDIADEHQAASRQSQPVINAVWFKRTGDSFAALVKAGDEIAAHQAKPVGISRDLVIGIDSRDRVFQIDDCSQCGFKDDIGDVQCIGRAHRMLWIDQDLNMQAMMLEQVACGVTYLRLRHEIAIVAAS